MTIHKETFYWFFFILHVFNFFQYQNFHIVFLNFSNQYIDPNLLRKKKQFLLFALSQARKFFWAVKEPIHKLCFLLLLFYPLALRAGKPANKSNKQTNNVCLFDKQTNKQCFFSPLSPHKEFSNGGCKEIIYSGYFTPVYGSAHSLFSFMNHSNF